MKFEHLVQINDPALTHIAFLTREQLWFGLVARAWKPADFILGMENAEITLVTQTNDNTTLLERKLNYGSFQIQDSIALYHEERTENIIPENQFCGHSEMRILIEEPKENELWLRFQYTVTDKIEQVLSEGTTQAQVDEVRQQAYYASDIDTVQLIREIVKAMPSMQSLLPN
jgi:Domain of unknown function (DUF1857)